VQKHLAEPDAATPTEALSRAVRLETHWGQMARELVNRVGTLADLESLDTAPHPDEPFAWSTVADRDRPFVDQVVALLDDACGRSLDVEYRTIARRLLARVLQHDPRPLRRSSRPERIACGILHAVLDANEQLGRRRRWRASDIAGWFATSSASDNARTLVAAAALPRTYEESRWTWPQHLELPSPQLLHSSTRAGILRERSALVEAFLEEERRRAGRRPLVDVGDGRVEMRGCVADVAIVRRGEASSGQVIVVLGLAPVEPDPDLELYALSVPEARRLQAMLDDALDTATPRPARLR
jgi:hypothetical protein